MVYGCRGESVDRKRGLDIDVEVDVVEAFNHASFATAPALSGWCFSRALWYASLICCLERTVPVEDAVNGRLRIS